MFFPILLCKINKMPEFISNKTLGFTIIRSKYLVKNYTKKKTRALFHISYILLSVRCKEKSTRAARTDLQPDRSGSAVQQIAAKFLGQVEQPIVQDRGAIPRQVVADGDSVGHRANVDDRVHEDQFQAVRILPGARKGVQPGRAAIVVESLGFRAIPNTRQRWQAMP